MEGTLQQALQDGKAHPRMKKIWTIRWMASFVPLFIFLMVFIGQILMLGLREQIFGIGILGIILFFIILPIILGFIVAFGWAHLYWNNYRFDVGNERVTISRGVIGKRITNIPYERIQNINIWRGIWDRLFGLYSLQIQTAGGFSVGGTGGYGTRGVAEGSIQGLINPQPVVDFIMAKAKGRDGLGDLVSSKKELGKEEKLSLLEERLLRGEISERTYEELKRRHETPSTTSSSLPAKPPAGLSVKCYSCGHVMQITSTTRPLEVVCSNCGAKGTVK